MGAEVVLARKIVSVEPSVIAEKFSVSVSAVVIIISSIYVINHIS